MANESKREVIIKDVFIEQLDNEFESMKFKKPKCTYEYIYNDAIQDIIDNLRTFMDKDWQKDIEFKLNDEGD